MREEIFTPSREIEPQVALNEKTPLYDPGRMRLWYPRLQERHICFEIGVTNLPIV